MHALPLLVAFFLLDPDVIEAPRVEAPTVIRNITVISAPGEKLENGRIVIDHGCIVGVGKDAAIPLGAREIDGDGLIAYAGFVDAFSRVGVKAPPPSAAEERRVEDEFESVTEGPRVAIEQANRNGVYARRQVEDLLDFQDETFNGSRQAGFTASLLAPPQAILGGRAAVLELGDIPIRRSILRSEVAQIASFVPPSRRAIRERGRWPSTAFGVIAQMRQTMSDAQWYRDMRAYAAKHPEARAQLPQDRDLEALLDVLAASQPLAWEADSQDEILRALNLSREFGVKPILIGAHEAYRCIDQLKAANAPLIVGLKVPPKVKEYRFNPDTWLAGADDLSLFGRLWNKRPVEPKAAYDEARRLRDDELHNAIALEKAGLTWCAATIDAKPTDALAALREVIAAGLAEDVALRAVTVSPARILGVDAEVGTIAVGKRANLTIMTGPLADKKTKVRWVFVDGRQYEIDAAKKDKGGKKKGDDNNKDKDNPDDDDEPGPASANRPAVSQPTSQNIASHPTTGSAPASAATSKASSHPATPYDDVLTYEPNWPVETPRDRDPGFKTGGNVLLKNAYVIRVVGDDLPNTSVLVEGGKIKQIGANIAAPAGVRTIDLTGYAIMPGVFDPHSHIALDAVNEFSLSVTPEVRCADVVRSNDISVYRALAGGCTTIHAMHGSANTIGGQCVVLKLKYGQTSADMIFKDAPRTVKFATGENVTRGGHPPGYPPDAHVDQPIKRFPATRMGVETVMRRALSAGRQYGEEHAAHEKAVQGGKDVAPIRRDLRLEALADIVAGRIFVNCHCYRADEILRVLAVAEDFGFRIANLHHCLEAYRIMPEIVRHGAGTCTFSDWWAYKIEAFQAVPHNAGMLLRAGVDSSIKSDSPDLMRHLPLEAAKCMKSSGLTPNEALRLVTLNPAKQFELDSRIGSIEIGKDADIAVYDGHPLDSFSKCVLTLVDGEAYFRHRDFNVDKPTPPARPIKEFKVADWVRDAAEKNDLLAAAGLRGEVRTEHDAARASSCDVPSDSKSTAAKPAAYALTHATLHTVSNGVIEDGTLVIRDGKIAAVGKNVDIPTDAATTDCRGRHVYPGLIDAATVVGMYEIDQVDVTQDVSECGMYEPDVVAASSFHPHSAMVAVACADGVTTVHLVPAGPAVAGQSSIVDLAGWTMPEMLRAAQVGLVAALPSGPVDPLLERKKVVDPEDEDEGIAEESPKEEEARKAQAELERFFRDAQVYARGARTAKSTGAALPVAPDPRFDAIAPYVLGEKQVLFAAGGYKQILEALVFTDKLGLRPIILGGRDAWKCADLLVRRRVPVIYDSVFAMPGGLAGVPTASEPWNANYRAMAVMKAAGVKFCLANRSSTLAKQLPTDAGFGVAHGLDPEAALRAMTLSAAEILGVADTCGSLDVGKRADVVVSTDHPCQATSRVQAVFVAGRPVSLDTIHTQNAERFGQRPAPNLPPARTDLRGPKSQSRP